MASRGMLDPSREREQADKAGEPAGLVSRGMQPEKLKKS